MTRSVPVLVDRFTAAARAANCRLHVVSWALLAAGEHATIKRVLLPPPSESCKTWVSLEFRKGTWSMTVTLLLFPGLGLGPEPKGLDVGVEEEVVVVVVVAFSLRRSPTLSRSASVAITSPSAVRLLLILMASFRASPLASLFEMR